ncbi:MAG: hypothetical protein QOF66_5035 [Mycobacterium sp.]|nr:hypothetical protein [Mycobacterium sp.]
MQQRSSRRRGQADITDLRLTLSTQLMQTNPVTAAERLVAQTATDAATQAARVATFPIPRAVLLNLSRALGGGGVRGRTCVGVSRRIYRPHDGVYSGVAACLGGS